MSPRQLERIAPPRTEPPLARLTAPALRFVRLAVAAAFLLAVSYVVSWQLLWGGMAGSEAPFHLHLVDWVAGTFPNLPWWYPWDGMGVSFREGYPLASHWLAVAISHLLSTTLEGGAQVIQFALMPATATGLYAFFDWRLRRPMAGVAAGLLFLLSPIGWVEWTHFGLFASWVGMVFFMPAVIALDAFFYAWLRRDGTWRYRVAAFAFIALATVMGLVSPHLLAAPLLVAAAYALAVPRSSPRSAWRWLLITVPALYLGIAILSAFWLGGELQYLGVVRSHWAGAGTSFDIQRLSEIDLGGLLSLHPIQGGNLGDLYGVTPAVLLPALLGALLAWSDRRARVLLGLAVIGIVFMVERDLYRPFFAIPGFKEFGVVAHRPLQLLVAVAAPSLAALGLFELPRLLTRLAAIKLKWPASMRSGLAVALPIVLVAVLAVDVYAFAGRVEGGNKLAYGPAVPGATDLNDLWWRHPGQAVPLAQQLFDLSQWRTPTIACDLNCPAKRQSLAALGATFPSPPARAELNSNIGPLDMAFHLIVGGGITHSYNDQVIPSRELSSWLEDSMLQAAGTTVKQQLSQALGIDAVVLSKAQAGRAADYTAMGWTQVSQDPLAFVNPQPSGLAAQWPGGTAVLVVGATQNSVPELYNSVFKQATSGILPFDSEWLARGTSPYIDDYSEQELKRYRGILLLGYRYHDQAAAWSRLEQYVRGGGRLFVETGWQYVDPDWNAGQAPAVLPVPVLQWSALDRAAPVLVGGAADPGFGTFAYQGGGWGASSAGAVRPGATELVRVGGRVVVARSEVGQGRVLWSGMNLIAHSSSSASADEAQFLASQLAWLFTSGAGSQVPIAPLWEGDDQATLVLQPSDAPSLVLFKESLFPGWSARLVTPRGSQRVDLVGGEMDFMLAALPAVPAGSSLVFSYGPTALERTSWGLSLAFLALLVAWALRPALLARGRKRLAVSARRLLNPLARRTEAWGEDP
jgi:hypothetical protein